MDYSDFYDIATYQNKINYNMFTEKEVAVFAYDYICDYTNSIKSLFIQLKGIDSDDINLYSNSEIKEFLIDFISENC